MSPVLEKTRQANGECRDEDFKSRVTVVGSGNWGSVAAKLIASNALKLPSFHGKNKKKTILLSIQIEQFGDLMIWVCFIVISMLFFVYRTFRKNQNFICLK